MIRIRLARFGAKKRPTYRLAIFDRAKDNLGKAIEYLGSYNPRTNPKTIQFNTERIKYWLSKGAQPTPTVHNLLVDQKIVEGKKVKAFRLVKTEKPAEAAPKPATTATPEAAPEAPAAPAEAASAPEVKPEEPAATA
ncbi:MAG: 30S ribosomal protein S16 [Patescibacteria group bacterium]|jgi:small subunit ribosomal protein S16